MSANTSGTQNEADWRREQLRRTLDHWRESHFDPYIILSVPRDATQQQIIDSHRRWVSAYHPDRHGNDPIASEVTKHLNAARDKLLGEDRRVSPSQRDQGRKQGEAQRQTHRGGGYQQNATNTRNSLSWTIFASALVTLIIAYLILTVTAPESIESLMQEWARLFDRALAR